MAARKKDYHMSIRCYFPGGGDNKTQHYPVMPLKDIAKWVEASTNFQLCSRCKHLRIMVKWADKNTQDKAGIIVKRIRTGFTLMEMLIVIAIIAVLIAIAIPVFSSQLEKTREATDLTNVRSAYAQVSSEALLGNSEITVTVDLTQKQADWQSLDPVDIGGIVHYKKQGDTDN